MKDREADSLSKEQKSLLSNEPQNPWQGQNVDMQPNRVKTHKTSKTEGQNQQVMLVMFIIVQYNCSFEYGW